MSALHRVIVEEAFPPHADYRCSIAQSVARLLPQGLFLRCRTLLYRLGGVEIGHGSVITGRLRLWGGGRLSIGENTTVNTPCAICLDAGVRIGNGVLIGHDTIFATGDHEIGPPGARGGPLRPRGIVVEDGAWIGAGVLVLPGVTIGRGAVVAGGAVVTVDVEPDTVVGGVPARRIRPL